ncbi:Lysozyme c-1 [Pseudolycoriella hygida]|uniref:lysozyme n=1 Tax=Pseudolycoriella hygida TaxID=35572 RepID=A0A9Q0S3A6_9DIPT|nr:Lysozyme c-1 [Pseudolycoriella hygida]
MRNNIVCIFTISFGLLTLMQVTNGKIFSRCELKKALEKNKVNRSFIAHWVCLAESESGRNSSKLTKKILYDMYGIFQIHSNEWCGRGGVIGGSCWTRCDNFLDDKLDDDIACAMKVFDKYGFKNWKGWEEKCKKQDLPNLSDCT